MPARVVLGVGKGVLFREVSSVQECPHREVSSVQRLKCIKECDIVGKGVLFRVVS